jgi:hypothetical protein
MHLARKHIILLDKIMQSHPEFHDVRFLIGTSHDGCLWIEGVVKTEKDLSGLKGIVASTKPPVFVMYDVTLAPKEKQNDLH